jgi:protein tyrosine phosphatase (PTP) superfamily phosphohydrolase (DUF442 family)
MQGGAFKQRLNRNIQTTLFLGRCTVRLNQRLARTGIAGLFIASSLAGPAAAQTANTGAQSTLAGAQSPLVDISRIRIDNFGRVNSSYYRGAQPKGQDYADLASLGIRTVINLTSDDADASEKTMTDRAGMGYAQIPMTTHEPPTAAKLAEFLKLVNDPARQPVYVHCVGGRHRTGVMTAAYRMTKERWTADQAFKEMKQYKFGAEFLHSEFKDFVYRYRPEPIRTAASPVPAVVSPAGTMTKVGG